MKKIVITDLDGTLTKGSLVLEHCGHLESLGVINTNGAFENWNADRKNEKLITECAIAYQSALAGVPTEKLDTENFVKNFIQNKNNWYQKTLEIANTNETIIISGSADFLVQELCKQLGKNYKGFGSVYGVEGDKLTGKIKKAMFHADAKREQITEILGTPNKETYVIGMGDTSSDKSIFNVGDYNILVEPTKETLEFMITNQIKIDEIVKA